MIRALIGTAALLLAGCVAAPSAPPVSLTPEQAYYAAVASYSQALDVAVAFKAQCDKEPVQIRGDCAKIVSLVQHIDDQAGAALGEADKAFEDGNLDLLRVLTVELTDARQHLIDSLPQTVNPVQPGQ